MNNARITQAGALEINGKIQICPFQTDIIQVCQISCNTSCVLFSEPQEFEPLNDKMSAYAVLIELCNGKELYFESFVDERDTDTEEETT